MQLLPSSFRALEADLGLSPTTLAASSLMQTLTCTLTCTVTFLEKAVTSNLMYVGFKSHSGAVEVQRSPFFGVCS